MNINIYQVNQKEAYQLFKFIITIHKEEVAFLDQVRKKYTEAKKCASIKELVIKIIWHALETFDCEFVQLYGLTEFSPISALTGDDHLRALDRKAELPRF